MKKDTIDLLLLGGLAVGGYFLLKGRGAAQAVPSTTQPIYIPFPTTTPATPAPYTPAPVTPSPAAPAPAAVPGFNVNQFLSAVGQAALSLFPQGAPAVTPSTTFGLAQQPGYQGSSFGQLGPLPVFNVDFSQYGSGLDIFAPGEVSFAV
jgi:hypothetical protein